MPTKAKVTLASEPTEKMTAEETKPEVKGIKMEDVEKHSSVDDLWLVIDGACRDQILERERSLAGRRRPSVRAPVIAPPPYDAFYPRVADRIVIPTTNTQARFTT